MITHFGFRVASDDVVTTLQREAEMRAVRLQVHLAQLEQERARLDHERAAVAAKVIAERIERKRRRVVEMVILTVASIAMLVMIATSSGPFKGMGR